MTFRFRFLPTLGLAILLIGASCAPVTTEPPALHPRIAALQPERISLPPVIFLDQPIDRYLETQFGREMYRWARRILEKKGYEIVGSGMGGPDYSVSKEVSESRLRELALEGVDAVMLIWIDHFLDAGFYNTEGTRFLEVYATAALFTVAAEEELWRDQGYGRVNHSFLSANTLGVDWLRVPAELAESLFDSLPDAPGLSATPD